MRCCTTWINVAVRYRIVQRAIENAERSMKNLEQLWAVGRWIGSTQPSHGSPQLTSTSPCEHDGVGRCQEDVLQSSWPIFQVLHVMSCWVEARTDLQCFWGHPPGKAKLIPSFLMKCEAEAFNSPIISHGKLSSRSRSPCSFAICPFLYCEALQLRRA